MVITSIYRFIFVYPEEYQAAQKFAELNPDFKVVGECTGLIIYEKEKSTYDVMYVPEESK